MMPSVTVISRWCNEAALAPYFLGHYAWADEIIIKLDQSTTDQSAELIAEYPNASFEYFSHGGKLNDRLLAGMMSDLADSIKTDWIIYVDADELICTDKEALSRVNGRLVKTWFHWAFLNEQDKPLNPALPAVPQRPYGTGAYVKPVVVRSGNHIRWTVGQHDWEPNYYLDNEISKTVFHGRHWQMADIDIAIARRFKDRDRYSAENLRNGWGVQHFDITEERIRAEFAQHFHDPLIVAG